MDDLLLSGSFISGVVGVILLIIVTILGATCGKELYLFDSSRWAADWEKSNTCSKTKFMLFWIGVGLIVIPLILLFIGSMVEVLKNKSM